ncbi:coiled-coil domain-containing protein 180 isoform X2 [Centropristis striata]|uniref:coiled-coil domain-containing protein 180 isoform X2 n=1 Tax=Centropristis striata TaxID=184440 RepID=UPI0027E16FC0|nr:coiled-coil domain-containing protein 180 isoform X2 [Centropristis striata]
MCESRTVPSGKVYRQLFDAQVQLSRSLMAGRRDTRTDCLFAEDSETHCSTTSRLLCLSSRGQQDDDEDDDDDEVDDVSRLPDSVVVDRPSSDIIQRLTEKKNKKHKEALKQLGTELTHLSQVCETQVRSVSQQLLSSLQDVDLRLKMLKDRMDQLDQQDHVSLQDVCVLWEQVEQQVKLKKSRIVELKHKLSECETGRADEIRVVLRKFLHLLQNISFLSPPDACRLIHTQATMLNQSLLANRRSAARLLLLLQEENLQQESLLRLHWEDCLSHWRRTRVSQVIDRFRSLCSGEEDQLIPGRLVSGQLEQDLTQRRDDIIYQMCSLVPPTCSTALVSDWFNQLTAVNQQIDCLHADLLHQIRSSYEQTWEDRLSLVERCQEELSALQLSEDEVQEILSSQLLPLIGRRQSQDEERMAALDVSCDCVSRQAVSLSRCVFVVLRGAALLWETHRRDIERREEELQQHLDHLRHSQQLHTQRRKLRLDDLLGDLRQQSSEDALKTSLDKSVLYLEDVRDSYRQCVCEQWEVLECLPSLLLEELFSYSRRLAAFFHLSHAYTPSPEELQKLHPSLSQLTEDQPIRWQGDTGHAQPSEDWLAEEESSLMDLYDVSSNVTFTSSGGVAYSGPAFSCPSPDLKQDTHLSLFPTELLTQTLSRVRTLVLDQLQQQFVDVLRSAVAVVTERKEAVRSEQEVHLQQLNPEHIQTHIYQPRLAELQLHRQQVDSLCEEVQEVLSSCKVALQELQTSVNKKNQELIVRLSNMEDAILTADSSRRLQALSSTLQDCVDEHMKDTQSCHTSFSLTLHSNLQQLRGRTAHLLSSFRLFSEGGDFAPQEVKLFQRRLKEETRRISVTEENLHSELELFQSKSLQQVKEASGRLEEKLSLLQSELDFTEKTQRVINSTRVKIKAEAAVSNQQQSVLSNLLEDLRRMKENTKVSPDQVCSSLSSVIEELKKRFQYLDLSVETLSADPESRRPVQVQSAPLGSLQTCRTGVELLEDPAVSVIKTLNRPCGGKEPAAAAGQSPAQRPAQRVSESVSTLRGCRSIRAEKRFQVFGAEPEQNPCSFSSRVDSLLWMASDVLLQVAEEFYLSERLSRFQLLPDSLDQWAESTQQRLLGYQEQSRKFLSTSREEVVSQLSVLDDLLSSLPAVLISNHERQQGAGLMEAVGGVRLKLEETMAASEEEKRVNVRQLRVSLREDELQAVISREEERQQQLEKDIICCHLELQVCLQVRGEGFVTSLSSLVEQLLHQLDELPTGTSPEHLKTPADLGQRGCSRTWAGVPYLTPPTDVTDDPASIVTTATTASITTTRCTLGHQRVIEQRDAAVKRFQLIFSSEFLHSFEDKQRHLSELNSWNTHWRQQIHTLTHTL